MEIHSLSEKQCSTILSLDSWSFVPWSDPLSRQNDASYHADNEPMFQSNTAAWALTTLVQEQQLTAPEVVEISDEERPDNGTAGVNTDINDLGGGNGSEQLDDDDFHAPSTNADFAAFAIPAGE